MATTESTPAYWNKNGKHQFLYDVMEDVLVPHTNEAKTRSGEILRLCGNVYYEAFNNGGSFYSGQRSEDARKLKRLVTFATPKLSDEPAWDRMADACVEKAWLLLLEEPEAFALVHDALHLKRKHFK